jgi:uncharacterized membrane protein YhhN
MRTRTISVIYFIIGIISIILLNQPAFWPGFISKVMIIPVLVILLLANLNLFENRSHGFMIAGLIFSWAGDVFLEFTKDNSNMFIIGLVCFLLAHVMYFTVFIITPGENTILTKRVYLLVPVIIYGAALVSYLYDGLGEMKLPVIIYAIVILTMLSGALDRKGRVNNKSYYLILAGAIIFVISDSTIAISKFSHQFKLSELVIMSSYIVAQYLIVRGYIYQFGKIKPDQMIL